MAPAHWGLIKRRIKQPVRVAKTSLLVAGRHAIA